MTGRTEKLLDRQVDSIAVVRMLSGLGDMLCLVPALRALRTALPEAHVSLIGLPSSKEFVTRFDCYIDELVESPGCPGIPEARTQIGKLPSFFAAMQERRFDLALQLHGDGTITNLFTVMLGACLNGGFFVPGRFCPDTKRFLPYREDESEATRYLRLLSLLGIPPMGEGLEFPLRKEDREALSLVPEARKLEPGAYVCVHPGAHEQGRRWPPELFARVADAVYGLGFPIVLTGYGPERSLTRKVAAAMESKPLDLAGRTTLGALAVLLSNARLLVCNDTGVSHLAAALRVPSVVIFTGSDPARWAPSDSRLHRAVNACPQGGDGGIAAGRRGVRHHAGIKKVFAAVEDLLCRGKCELDAEPPSTRAPLYGAIG